MMSTIEDDWRLCFELGTNHLGSYPRLENMLLQISNLSERVSVTVQIKEESFYEKFPEYELTSQNYLDFIELCHKFEIQCGLALGPLENIQNLKKQGINPDFIKTLSIASADPIFMDKLCRTFVCPKYISVGLSNISYIKDTILPFMNNEDMLIHTCLSHDSGDQNLLDIQQLKYLGKSVCFGLHSMDHEIVYTAIGAGADKIFVYAGDKNLNLTDLHHAVDLPDVGNFSDKVASCFSAMGASNGEPKKMSITFVG